MTENYTKRPIGLSAENLFSRIVHIYCNLFPYSLTFDVIY